MGHTSVELTPYCSLGRRLRRRWSERQTDVTSYTNMRNIPSSELFTGYATRATMRYATHFPTSFLYNTEERGHMLMRYATHFPTSLVQYTRKGTYVNEICHSLSYFSLVQYRRKRSYANEICHLLSYFSLVQYRRKRTYVNEICHSLSYFSLLFNTEERGQQDGKKSTSDLLFLLLIHCLDF